MHHQPGLLSALVWYTSSRSATCCVLRNRAGVLGFLSSKELFDLRTMDIGHHNLTHPAEYRLPLPRELFASTAASRDTIVMTAELLEELEVVRLWHLLADFSSKVLRKRVQPRRLAESISPSLIKFRKASPS